MFLKEPEKNHSNKLTQQKGHFDSKQNLSYNHWNRRKKRICFDIETLNPFYQSFLHLKMVIWAIIITTRSQRRCNIFSNLIIIIGKQSLHTQTHPHTHTLINRNEEDLVTDISKASKAKLMKERKKRLKWFRLIIYSVIRTDIVRSE